MSRGYRSRYWSSSMRWASVFMLDYLGVLILLTFQTQNAHIAVLLILSWCDSIWERYIQHRSYCTPTCSVLWWWLSKPCSEQGWLMNVLPTERSLLGEARFSYFLLSNVYRVKDTNWSNRSSRMWCLYFVFLDLESASEPKLGYNGLMVGAKLVKRDCRGCYSITIFLL